MNRLALVLLPLALGACGTPIPPWSADYARQATTRDYAAPRARVLAAAEEVLRLSAAPRDVTISPRAGGFVGDRYFVAMRGLESVTGDYRFAVSVTPTATGSRIRVTITDLNGFDGPATPFSLTQSGENVQFAAPYTLFFARMDYLLGRRASWPDCNAAPTMLGLHEPLDPLCLEAADRRPPAQVGK